MEVLIDDRQFNVSQEDLNGLRKGDRKIFENIFSEYYERLVRFAEGYVFDHQVSEDVVQDFFVWLWENRKSLLLRTSLKTYFFTAVRNRCFDYLKSRKVKDKYRLMCIQAVINISDEEIDNSHSLQQLREAIDKLPPEMSKVFKARYYKQLKIEEVAAELEISVSTVKTQLARGKRKLRVLIPDCALLFLL
ncbi:RNA polymerase sigma-70 factor [Saccharicrinis fermentans]|uniref:RNA polymerase sigma factor SigV n=1 Tax=Saccharicrinis fermentans DSM 9555 = JCM 21142 TaxID=869213 RepID=W7Y597_9BACT|nr:RNA polymerase sigma-70 factor [Saccharicrinis fermentans]GAF02723.1 RNA polymerase sigma factor SigV [Saccharicrinis fermentans DSM 9555 = JCM 21142]